MRSLISLFTLLAPLAALCVDFGDLFTENTLRVDVRLVVNGSEQGLAIDSVAVWPGWYGRRGNLATPQYLDPLDIMIIDEESGDTIYADTKYLNNPAPEEKAVAYNTIFAPVPKQPSRVVVVAYGYGPEGREMWQETSFRFTPGEIVSTEESRLRLTPYKVLRQAADPEHCISLAILAEGYTSGEMDKFISQAVSVDSALFTQPGFKDNAELFTVVAVMLPSEESGISRPSKGIVKKSALGAHFDSFNLDRLITIADTRPMWDALEGIPASKVLILANTETYGGSGPYNEYAIASAGYNGYREILIHEFGHSFASLGDEYEAGFSIVYTPDFEPPEPNITTLHDFSQKWQNLIDSGEASLIEGAGYQSKGVWRGCEKCLMRSIADHYLCPVCAQAITRTIRYYSNTER